MGCAPSAELVCDAPFRPPQGGVRQVALIPIVEHFFPTPDCALFKQLYEAYTDPSVRYYVRANFDGENGDLSRIPDIINTRAQLHQLLLQLTNRGLFATNADVRAAYAKGDGYRIRPILCAVVFLYEGANYVPEGSVQLPTHGRGPSVFVKVIGVVGDTSAMLRRAGDPPIAITSRDTLKMQTLITKSAGDHNMSRVVLLASYIYYHQCVEIIGLPKTPSMAACFTCFKTNIPFLCFLREMRDRTASVLESPKDSKFYIDEHCLHGAVTKEYVDIMMPAFAFYFVSFLNAKTEQRLVKQLAHQQRAIGAAKEASHDSQDSSTSAHHHHHPDERHDPDASKGAGRDGNHHNGNAAPKVTYIVKGYLTRAATSLSAWSRAANEVYVACVDGTVTVVDRRSVDAPDGPTHTPTLGQAGGVEEVVEERGVPTSARRVVETVAVRRGDILSFYIPSSPLAPDAAAEDAEAGHRVRYCTYEDGDDDGSESATSSQARFLRLHTDDDSALPSPTMSSVARVDSEGSVPVQGSWRIDDGIFIESVLLSLVRDECKLAREADVDDPRWVHDSVKNCPVHDGSFYVWHFRRGQENFFYGTVPKFANTNRTQGRGGGASGPRALRNGGVRVSKSGMQINAHSSTLNTPSGLASAMIKLDGVNGVGGAAGRVRGANSAVAMPQQQPQQLQRLGLPALFPSYGMSTDPAGVQQQQQMQHYQQQQQQQSQNPPSYIASSQVAPSVNTGVQVGNALSGSGPIYVIQNGSGGFSTASPAGQLMYNVPYVLPGQPLQQSMAAPPPHGVPSGAFLSAHPQQQTPTWLSMGDGHGAAPSSGNAGTSVNTPNFSVSSNVSATANAPGSLPYVMNAQGQLVAWPNMRMEKGPHHGMQAAVSTPPAPPVSQQAPSYVLMNGQLCLLQPASAAPPPPPPPQFCVPAPQQQQFANSYVYIQRQ